MLANPYTKFTPFEKKALCAFGCTDKEITLENLDAVATMAHHKETAARFDRLISKLKREVFPGYHYDEVFYACAAEREANNVKEALAYQKATGDILTGRPWRNYGKAELVNEFCDDDPYTTSEGCCSCGKRRHCRRSGRWWRKSSGRSNASTEWSWTLSLVMTSG